MNVSTSEEEPATVKKKTLFKKPLAEASAEQGEKEEAKSTWSNEQDSICPATKSTTFARMPAISIRGGVSLPAGNIILRYGAHYGYNNGFGFQHIWREHFHHIKDHDSAMEAVIERLSSILLSGTNIFYDAGKRASLFLATSVCFCANSSASVRIAFIVIRAASMRGPASS